MLILHSFYQILCHFSIVVAIYTAKYYGFIILIVFIISTWCVCKAVTGLATFSARIVIYLMLIRRAGT